MFDEWLRAPRRLRLVFLAVMLLLAGTLGWLAWRLLAQDRQLVVQQLADQRDAAADLAVVALERRLSAVEQDLSRVLADDSAPPTSLSSGAIFVQFGPGVIRAWPEDSLVYYPDVPAATEAPAALFTAADDLEHVAFSYRLSGFRSQDRPRAEAESWQLTAARVSVERTPRPGRRIPVALALP